MTPGTRTPRQARATPPPQPSSSKVSPAFAGTVAAISTGSAPARYPVRGCQRRTAPPRKSSRVRSSGANGSFLKCDPVFAQHAPCLIKLIRPHHEPARQDADGAFEDAHIYVQFKAGYTLVLKNGAGERYKSDIIGA